MNQKQIKPLIYIAGPYTKGDQNENIFNALKIGDYVYTLGAIPYVPHLTHYWSIMTIDGSKRDYDEWMHICFNVLNRCDALVRLPGESIGSDMEVEYAKELNKPIFLSTEMDKIKVYIDKYPKIRLQEIL